MSYPQIPFKMSEITIQPQAKLCMQKLHITEEEVLETINEWESGDIEATTPTEANTLAAFPETADEIPAFYSSARTFPERNIIIAVKYSTTIKKQQDKVKIHASVHWVSTRPPLELSNDLSEAPGDWLEPKGLQLNTELPPITLLLHEYQVKLLMIALTLFDPRNTEQQHDTNVLLEIFEELL
jgi:hypothetical protein